MGCGRLEKIAQNAACHTGMPRGTRTSAMARPSGMLWTAIAAVMKVASACVPPNETPTPTPSANECAVITAMMRKAFFASSRDRSAKWPFAPADVALGEHDAGESDKDAQDEPRGTESKAFGDEAMGGGEHHSRGNGICHRHPVTRETAQEQERQSA